MQGFSTPADVERFLLLHGEHIVDVLGSEVDRIEAKIKVISNTVHNVLRSLCFSYSRNTLQK